MDTEYVLTCYLSKKGKEEKYNAKALLGADVFQYRRYLYLNKMKGEN